jgi:MFS family permease
MAALGTVVEPVATRDRLAGVRIAAVGLGALVASLAGTLVIPVLPIMSQDLGVTPADAQWLLTTTLLVSAVSVLVLGRLGDMFGRRRILLLSLVGLMVGSVINALTSDFTVMLVGRGICGLAAACVPLGMSLLAASLPPERRGMGVAVVSAMLGVGGALALPVAGFLADRADYHVLFWIGAAASALSLVAVSALVEEPRFPRTGRVDGAGIVLLSVGLTALLLGISQGHTWGWTSVEDLAAFTIAIGALVALLVVETRIPDPLIDLAAVRVPAIALTHTAGGFVGVSLFASYVGTAAYVQAPEESGYGFGSSIFVSGLCLLPSGVLMMIVAPFGARAVARFGGGAVLAVAGVVLAVGQVERIVITNTLWEVLVGVCLVGAGGALGYSALPALVNLHTPPVQLAAANGINALARIAGGCVSSAFAGAVLSALTIDLAGSELPSLRAYQVLFAVCGAAALVVAAIGLVLHRGPARLVNDRL